MLRHILVVTLLLLLQRCGAQPPCPENDKTKCTAELHTVAETCTDNTCECVPGYSPNVALCELSKPKISGETAEKKFFIGTSYSFVCDTDVTGTTTFEWSKDAQKLTETKKTFAINDAKATDSGSYKCKIIVGADNAESAPITVTVVAPGMPCTGETECTGPEFSGSCSPTDPKRCVCAADYIMKEGTCKSEARPACGTDNAACVAPLYKPNTCTADHKCECAEGLAADTATGRCELKAPSIKEDNAGKTYYTNVDYKLECTTTASDATFKWYKGTDEMTGATSKTYTIKETQEASDIKYKCEITIGTGTEASKASSIEVAVTFVAPGKVCDVNGLCTGPEFSGKCDVVNTKRCVCAANYVVKEDTCSKNGAAVVNTSLLVLAVAIFSQLMKLS